MRVVSRSNRVICAGESRASASCRSSGQSAGDLAAKRKVRIRSVQSAGSGSQMSSTDMGRPGLWRFGGIGRPQTEAVVMVRGLDQLDHEAEGGDPELHGLSAKGSRGLGWRDRDTAEGEHAGGLALEIGRAIGEVIEDVFAAAQSASDGALRTERSDELVAGAAGTLAKLHQNADAEVLDRLGPEVDLEGEGEKSTCRREIAGDDADVVEVEPDGRSRSGEDIELTLFCPTHAFSLVQRGVPELP